MTASGQDSGRTVLLSVDEGGDGQSVWLSLSDFDNREMLGSIRAEAPDIEQLIESLARKRAALPDEVAREIDPGARINGVVDPLWTVADYPQEDGVLLTLRHPGIGWISWLLPRSGASLMGRRILARRDRASP